MATGSRLRSMVRQKWLWLLAAFCGLPAAIVWWQLGQLEKDANMLDEERILEPFHPISRSVSRIRVIKTMGGDGPDFAWDHTLVFDCSQQVLAREICRGRQGATITSQSSGTALIVKIPYEITHGGETEVGDLEIYINPDPVDAHAGCSVTYETDPTWLEGEWDALKRHFGEHP